MRYFDLDETGRLLIDMSLQILNSGETTAKGKEDARIYIDYLKKSGTDAEKEYIKQKESE